MPTSSKTKLVGGALVALSLTLVAACGGSQVSPEEALAANRAILGSGAGGSQNLVNPAGTVVDGGTGPAVSNGTGIAVGTGAGGGGGTGGGTGTGVVSGGAGTGPGAGTGAGGGSGTTKPVGAGSAAASCTGLKNTTGITDKTITIGNASDISGPIPGLFQAPQQAVRAYVAYFNATNPHGICGRKLVLNLYDTRTDAGADQQAYQKLCEETFAAVGSFSAFDSGGAATAQGCGLADVRATATTAARNNCSTCFGAQATGAYESNNALPDFFLKNYHAATQKAAFLYINAGAAAENAKTQISVSTSRGMKFVYTSGIDVASFNYGPYVQAMKSKGVQWVQFIGGYQQSVRLLQAFESTGYRPQVVHLDQTADDPGFIQQGGAGAEGTIVSLTYNPIFEGNPELNLYKQWLQQVSPGAAATGYGLYGWSAAKLFVQEALGLGGKLSRASLVAKLRTVHAWTADGMHGPMDVGGKHTVTCVRFEQVKNGRFVAIGGSKFYCGGITKAAP